MNDAWQERVPTLSVIIPNWNGSPFLFELLASLEGTANRETIVVDNGSSDGSVSMLRDYHPEVRRLELPINEGFARAVNRGLHLSRAPYIAIVNNDTSWNHDWMSPAVDFLEQNPAYDFAAPLVLNYFCRDRVDSAGDGITLSLRPYKRCFDRTSSSIQPQGRDLVAASCSAVVFRRSFFERVGSFDEDFFMYYEDVDLFFRGLLRGQRGRLLSGLTVFHREGGSIGWWEGSGGKTAGEAVLKAVIPSRVGAIRPRSGLPCLRSEGTEKASCWSATGSGSWSRTALPDTWRWRGFSWWRNSCGASAGTPGTDHWERSGGATGDLCPGWGGCGSSAASSNITGEFRFGDSGNSSAEPAGCRYY